MTWSSGEFQENTKISGHEDIQELVTIKYALDQAAIVAVTDSEGLITEVNDKFCEISGFSREELLGSTHRIVNSGQHSKDFFVGMWKTISGGEIWVGEVCNRSKQGELYWVHTTIVPFLDSRGKPYKYIAIRKDVSEQRRARLALQKERATAMYAEKMASLGEMAAGIAHEIGNPLGAIRGRIEMLESQAMRGDLSKDRVADTCRKVMGMIDRTTKIIRGLRSYARDASSDPFEECDICQLIEDIMDFSQARTSGLGIDVRIQRPSQIPRICCREAELGQVFVNLVSNACDAIKDLDEKWIEIKIREMQNFIRIEVRDSGKGINSDVAEKMFEPFYTTKTSGQGTGLGLSIASKIVKGHGGHIQIDHESANTCFVIDLPVAGNSDH